MNPIEQIPETSPLANLDTIRERLKAIKERNTVKDEAWEAEAQKLGDEVVEMEAGNKRLNEKVTSRGETGAGSGFFINGLYEKGDMEREIDAVKLETQNTVEEINGSIAEAEELKKSSDAKVVSECDTVIAESRELIDKISSVSYASRK